eukprot:5851778-Amphidinium_carterae.1
MRNVRFSLKASAFARISLFTPSKASLTSSATCSPSGTGNLLPPVRILAKAVPCSRSRAPSSSRRGTPGAWLRSGLTLRQKGPRVKQHFPTTSTSDRRTKAK